VGVLNGVLWISAKAVDYRKPKMNPPFKSAVGKTL
jgi:hypothetical protein